MLKVNGKETSKEFLVNGAIVALKKQQSWLEMGTQLLTCSLRPHAVFGPMATHFIAPLVARARCVFDVGSREKENSIWLVPERATSHT